LICRCGTITPARRCAGVVRSPAQQRKQFLGVGATLDLQLHEVAAQAQVFAHCVAHQRVQHAVAVGGFGSRCGMFPDCRRIRGRGIADQAKRNKLVKRIGRRMQSADQVLQLARRTLPVDE
jgi:hypothetical protein